jgi:general secretion pathway protein J
MERISSFLVECYDGSKWVRSWDTALNGALPKMLRITVQVVEDGQQVEFSALAPAPFMVNGS